MHNTYQLKFSVGINVAKSWSANSWRQYPAQQQATYPDPSALAKTAAQLAAAPALVSYEECQLLKVQLAKACNGEAFLLQGGDCAETFDAFSQQGILSTFKILLQMAIVLTQGAGKPVVKVGRIAGQFAKPRSSDTETINDVSLPSFRGDMINGLAFDKQSREPDPKRLTQCYFQSAATLNLLRSQASSGTASLDHVQQWNEGFIERSSLATQYSVIAAQVKASLDFMAACGIRANDDSALSRIDFFTSHEALHLEYENALMRQHNDRHFISSGHMLWIGDRTRQLDGAHVEMLSGVDNPIGLKVGPTMKPDELIHLIEKLNPHNEPGKLTLITRMGADNIAKILPPLVQRVTQAGAKVVWSSDPMHGNTHSSSTGLKTRSFDRILSEVRQFLAIHKAEGTHAGGIHLEMTGQHVTECIGGLSDLRDEDLPNRYQTACDPRLNADQVLEMAFILADELTA